MLYRDDHLEYKNDVLHLKKEKVLDRRAVKGNRGAADNSTAGNNGPAYKEIRPVKLDFSATNFKAKVTGWRLSIEKKTDVLFPAVCDCARGIAGISAASLTTVNSTQLDYQDPQILARANLPSEDEDTTAEHEKDKVEHHDNGPEGDDNHNDTDDDRGDNRVDDGFDSGVYDDRNKGDDDGIGCEEDEDHNGLGDGIISENDGNGGGINENEEADDEDSDNGDHHDEIEEVEGPGSDLTEIVSMSGSNSEVEFVPVSGRRGKGIQRHGGRH